MKVEIQRIHLLNNNESTLKAFFDVILEDSVLVKGFKLFNQEGTFRINVPQELGKDNRWYPSVDIINEDLKRAIQIEAIKAYKGE